MISTTEIRHYARYWPIIILIIIVSAITYVEVEMFQLFISAVLSTTAIVYIIMHAGVSLVIMKMVTSFLQNVIKTLEKPTIIIHPIEMINLSNNEDSNDKSQKETTTTEGPSTEIPFNTSTSSIQNESDDSGNESINDKSPSEEVASTTCSGKDTELNKSPVKVSFAPNDSAFPETMPNEKYRPKMWVSKFDKYKKHRERTSARKELFESRNEARSKPNSTCNHWEDDPCESCSCLPSPTPQHTVVKALRRPRGPPIDSVQDNANPGSKEAAKRLAQFMNRNCPVSDLDPRANEFTPATPKRSDNPDWRKFKTPASATSDV